MAVMVASSLRSAIFYDINAKSREQHQKASVRGVVPISHVRPLGMDTCNTTSASRKEFQRQPNNEMSLAIVAGHSQRKREHETTTKQVERLRHDWNRGQACGSGL